MKMIVVKTANLIGPALDWAVATAEGHKPLVCPTGRDEYSVVVIRAMDDGPKGFVCRYSTEWSQGGPLIEKYNIGLSQIDDIWLASKDIDNDEQSYVETGPTPLISACRAIVKSELGGVVPVPAELMGYHAHDE